MEMSSADVSIVNETANHMMASGRRFVRRFVLSGTILYPKLLLARLHLLLAAADASASVASLSIRETDGSAEANLLASGLSLLHASLLGICGRASVLDVCVPQAVLAVWVSAVVGAGQRGDGAGGHSLDDVVRRLREVLREVGVDGEAEDDGEEDGNLHVCCWVDLKMRC